MGVRGILGENRVLYPTPCSRYRPLNAYPSVPSTLSRSHGMSTRGIPTLKSGCQGTYEYLDNKFPSTDRTAPARKIVMWAAVSIHLSTVISLYNQVF